MLAGPAAPFSPTAPTTNLRIPFSTVVFLFGVVIVSFPLVWIGFLLLARYRGQTTPIPSRAVVMFLVVFLLAVGFIVLLRFAPGSGVPPSAVPPPGTNGTGGGTTPPGSGGTNNSTAPPFGPIPFAGIEFPGWLLYVGLVAAAVVAIAVAVPFVGGLRTPIPASAGDETAGRARKDFADALDALEENASGDPRDIIVGLYARLLRRLTRSLDHLETLAPREIERLCVERLGIRPGTARALTALFEEARYSGHVMPGTGVAAAREVFAQAIRDLDGGRTAA